MHGLAVTTVEGIGSTTTRLHPVQKRIAEAHGSQCGFCTPGIVMSMYALLRNLPKPTMKDMEIAFQGNFSDSQVCSHWCLWISLWPLDWTHTFANNYESRILFLHTYKYLPCTDTEKVLETYDMHQSVLFRFEVRNVWRDINTPTHPVCFIIWCLINAQIWVHLLEAGLLLLVISSSYSPNDSIRMVWISFGTLPCRIKNLMTVRVWMLLKLRASPDMLPFSPFNKKRLAICHINRPIFPTTLSILSYDIGK